MYQCCLYNYMNDSRRLYSITVWRWHYFEYNDYERNSYLDWQQSLIHLKIQEILSTLLITSFSLLVILTLVLDSAAGLFTCSPYQEEMLLMK